MANHKRGRAKNRRSGCLLCKPHKANGNKHKVNMQLRQVRRAPTVVEFFEGDPYDDILYEEWFEDDMLPCEEISLGFQELYLEEYIAANWPSRLGDLL